MPWLVSIRMMGDVMGTPRSTAIRMSVIRRSDGLELVLVFCGSASSVSLARNPAVSAPAAFLKKERRPWAALAGNTVEWKLLFVIVSSIVFSSGCLVLRSEPRPLGSDHCRWAGVAPPTTVSPVRSPVEFHGDLHAAPGVRLRAPEAEVGVLQRAAPAQRAKLGPVQQVEGLPSEVQVLLLMERNAPGQGDGFAKARPIAQFGVVPRHRAQRGSGLRAKPGCRLEEAVCPGIEFSRVTAGPAAVSTHRRPVCSVEDREADSSS